MAFSTTIQDRLIILKTARDVVRFSFIIRNSISYLDLELCQYSTASNCFGPLSECCRSWRSRNFINTDEKFRKLFSTSRRLLYTLHLDLPKGREYGLKEVPESVKYNAHFKSSHISKIRIACGFERKLLNNFIDDALNINFPKLKILKWILEVPSFPVPLLRLLETRTANKFIDCFYPQSKDSALFKSFVLQFGIIRFMTRHAQPKILEYLLYYSRLYERGDLEEDFNPIDENIGICIYFRLYLNIGAAMKYIDCPRFTSNDFSIFWWKISTRRPRLTMKVLRMSKKCLKQERIDHMFVIIWMYIDSNSEGCTEAASEALRLIWCSVSDACITYGEMKMGFEAAFSDEELLDMYGFYVRAMGESHESVEPRSLTHLCRTVLRRTLRKNKFWIPEGVSRTGLPKSLQSFLNLEKA